MKIILVKPVITEKSMSDASLGKFTFAVALEADKSQIKSAVENSFGVKVTGVTVSVRKGKTKMAGRSRRKSVSQSDWKKATVRLAKGQKIDLFDIAPAGGEA